jgi:DNA polymerase III epsilon subunit-like protein
MEKASASVAETSSTQPNKDLVLVFDTETTGLTSQEGEIISLSYIVYNKATNEVVYLTEQGDDIVSIIGETSGTEKIHGITKEMTIGKRPIKEHLDAFIFHFNNVGQYVAHNLKFDRTFIINAADKLIKENNCDIELYSKFIRFFAEGSSGKESPEHLYCTMSKSKGKCDDIAGVKKRGPGYKLEEVHKIIFKQGVGGQLHSSLVDCAVTLRVYVSLTQAKDICDVNRTIRDIINPTTIVSAEVDDKIGGGPDGSELLTIVTKMEDSLLLIEEIKLNDRYTYETCISVINNNGVNLGDTCNTNLLPNTDTKSVGGKKTRRKKIKKLNKSKNTFRQGRRRR